MTLFPDEDQTISGLWPQIRDRQVGCVDVVSRCLQQIDEGESTIQAWVFVDRDQALQHAQALDVELAAGRHRGPLHGIPIGIKDIIDVAGWPTAAGSPQWKDRIADRDATLVAQLREAGAVLLGKTVTTQYASFDPPMTRNPWNLERTPGGSSSGSAAAVATGMCLAAIGTQTGGSITRPASYCGVAGCKPSFGRVSTRGVLPLAPNMDHPGPLARCVNDLAIIYDVIAGYDPADPYSLNEPAGVIDTSPDADHELHAPRLGQLQGLFSSLAGNDVHDAFLHAAGVLQSAGAKIEPSPLPSTFDDVLERHRLVMAVEAAAVHEQRIAQYPEEYGPCITQLIDEGLHTTATEYARARKHQTALKRAILQTLDGHDAKICPATTDAAPDASTTGNPAFNSPWSYTGLPTVSFPMGLSRDGLPLAMQLVGWPFGEVHLFQAARWCERALIMRHPRS